MSNKLNQAIYNLRAEVLLRKLSAHNTYLSKTEAIKLVRINTDDEAFNYAFQFAQNPVSSWMKNRFSRVLNLWKK